jgi:hypothetical protein
METDYKAHTIEILTEEVHGKWTFRALVFVPDGLSQIVNDLVIVARTFKRKKRLNGKAYSL